MQQQNKGQGFLFLNEKFRVQFDLVGVVASYHEASLARLRLEYPLARVFILRSLLVVYLRLEVGIIPEFERLVLDISRSRARLGKKPG